MPSSFRIAAHAALPHRGRADRRDPPARAAREDPAQSASPQASATAKVLGDAIARRYPWLPGVKPVARRREPSSLLNRTWRPALSITGADGLPAIARRRQRAAPEHRARSSRCASRRRSTRSAPTHAVKQLLEARSALRRARALRRPTGVRRAGTRPPTRARGSQAAIDGASQAYFGKPGRADGRGRHDPLHGHARREVPERAVPDHRRARARVERARPQRVPPHPDGASA